MIVNELIDILNGFPGTMKVLVDGYETGYDDITSVDEESVFYIEDVEWWDGNYQETKFKEMYLDPDDENNKQSLSVIIIKRKNRT